MRNVTTICVCLPADLAESVRANAQRLGLSVSSYIKIRLVRADEADVAALEHCIATLGKEVNENGSAHQS